MSRVPLPKSGNGSRTARGFTKAVLKVVDGHARYIEHQLPFIDDAAVANDNLEIGSGPVEAACKSLVTQRLKVSGAKWSRKGAAAILYLRSVMQSGRCQTPSIAPFRLVRHRRAPRARGCWRQQENDARPLRR